MLLPGASGKKYIDQTSRLFNLKLNNTLHESMVLKAVYVMQDLSLQKPRKSSKSKEHPDAPTRQLSLWNEGRID